jgi:hypothetical protein
MIKKALRLPGSLGEGRANGARLDFGVTPDQDAVSFVILVIWARSSLFSFDHSI